MAEQKRYAEQIDPRTLAWQTPSGVTEGNQVQIAELPDGGFAMRESRYGDQGDVLWFTPAEWRAFVAGVRDGEFDVE